MKKMIYRNLALLFAAGTMLTGCQVDGLQLYEKLPDVYFSDLVNANASDSTEVMFAYTLDSMLVVSIRVSTSGKLADYDRSVAVVVDVEASTAYEGVHYELYETYIPAGQAYGHVNVTLLRDPSLSRDRDIKYLTLELRPNEAFGTDFQNAVDVGKDERRSMLRYKICISDILLKPRNWLNDYFGEYSEKKFLLICELNRFTPAFVDGREVLNGRYMLPGDVYAAARVTKIHLEHMKAAGTPVYEDEEETIEMTMGPQA